MISRISYKFDFSSDSDRVDMRLLESFAYSSVQGSTDTDFVKVESTIEFT